MIDPCATVRQRLVALPAVTAALPGGIYAGGSFPAGFDVVSRGAALLFRERGGDPAYHNRTWRVSLQFQVYAATEAAARAAAAVVCDQINDTRSGALSWIRLEPGTVPVLGSDPKTNWPFVLLFFEAQLRKED